MFFHTILLNSPFKHEIVNDNKRYIDFDDSHPTILTAKDYEKLKRSGKLFARKFEPKVDKEILDKLDDDAKTSY